MAVRKFFIIVTSVLLSLNVLSMPVMAIEETEEDTDQYTEVLEEEESESVTEDEEESAVIIEEETSETAEEETAEAEEEETVSEEESVITEEISDEEIIEEAVEEEVSEEFIEEPEEETLEPAAEEESLEETLETVTEEEPEEESEEETEEEETEQFLASTDFKYSLNSDGTITITGYTGSEKNLVIPSEIDGHSLKSIGDYAFAYNKVLESITIAGSVKNVGEGAFEGCANLKTVNISYGVESLGESSFYGCDRLTGVILPSSLSSIGDWLFANCTSLQQIQIPDSITSLPNSLFSGCTSLTSVSIPDSVTEIGSLVFEECSSLKTITIPGSVTDLQPEAFKNCTGLETIKLPASIWWLPLSTFEGCTSLRTVEFGGPISISKTVFKNCTSLQKINCEKITQIADYAFDGCTNLREVGYVNINTGTSNSIGAHAFNGCTNLSRIDISPSLNTVEIGAFKDAPSSLTVYYYGTEAMFNKITVKSDNTPFKNAKKVFYPAITKLTLSEKSITINVGSTKQLNLTITPSNANPKSVTWDVRDETVAKVSSTGVVTGLKAGTTEVVVWAHTSSGQTAASCKVTVTSVAATGITVKAPKTAINVNETIRLTATISPSNATDKTVTWSSNNSSIASVDRNGNVTGRAPGKATITGTTHNGKKSSVTITVKPSVTGFNIEESSIELSVNNSYTLNYTVIPSDAGNKTVNWTSSNNAVATVSNGVVTAKSIGTAVITGKTEDGGYTDTVSVTTRWVNLKGFRIKDDTVLAKIGENTTVEVIYEPTDASNKKIEWTTDDSGIVRANADGTITGLKFGTTRLHGRSEDGGYTDESDVMVVFKDVADPGQFYFTYVYDMVERGIVTGWDDGTFRPTNNCNRAAVVTFLWRMLGRPEPSEMATFSDLTGNEEFDKAISWAAESGITTGWADNTFRPWNTCNRAAVLTFLWRATGEPEPTQTASFKDMTGNSDFDKAISWGVENGITTGWADNTFRPWNTCNRLAVVSFLGRYDALNK